MLICDKKATLRMTFAPKTSAVTVGSNKGWQKGTIFPWALCSITYVEHELAHGKRCTYIRGDVFEVRNWASKCAEAYRHGTQNVHFFFFKQRIKWYRCFISACFLFNIVCVCVFALSSPCLSASVLKPFHTYPWVTKQMKTTNNMSFCISTQWRWEEESLTSLPSILPPKPRYLPVGFMICLKLWKNKDSDIPEKRARSLNVLFRLPLV